VEYWVHNKQLACGIIVTKCHDRIGDEEENDTINRSDTGFVYNLYMYVEDMYGARIKKYSKQR
jgi:hypothetical protein